MTLALAAERANLRTSAEDQQRVEAALGRLNRYLGLVGLVALLLGASAWRALSTC